MTETCHSMSTQRVIDPGSRVTLHFSLALTDGTIIDSNFDKQPACFRIGDGNMLPGFEEQLIGLHSGADIKVTIPAAEAFGLAIPGNIHRISRSRFRQLLDGEYEDLQSGDVISFKDPAGYDLPAVVKEKYTDAAVMDFNHPLAGKDIVFRAKVIKVEDGDSQFTEVKL